jgi:hypothetical protein
MVVFSQPRDEVEADRGYIEYIVVGHREGWTSWGALRLSQLAPRHLSLNFEKAGHTLWATAVASRSPLCNLFQGPTLHSELQLVPGGGGAEPVSWESSEHGLFNST